MNTSKLSRLVLSGIAIASIGLAAPSFAKPDGAKPEGAKTERERPGNRERAERGERGERPERPGQRGERGAMAGQMRDVLESLNLNDDQKQQVRQIMQDARKDMQDARADLEAMEPQARRQEARRMADEIRSKVSAVLSDDQRATFDAKMNELQKQREQRGAQQRQDEQQRPALGARFEEAVAKLDLDDAQKAQVDKIIEKMRTDLQALRNDAQGTDPQVLREDVGKILEAARTELGGILTPEQQQQLRQAMRPRGNADGAPGNRPEGERRRDRQGERPEGGRGGERPL